MKKNHLFFAIVTPSFNQASFLGQTIQSVLSQISVDDFYCVMDGASKDDSLKVLKSFENIPNFSYISEPDNGQTDAINKGIRKITRWLSQEKIPLDQCIFAYINSDDYYQPQALSKVREIFSKNPDLSWLVGNCTIVNGNGDPIQSYIQSYKTFLRSLLSWPILLIVNPIPQPAVFVRCSAVQKVGLFNQDLDYTMDYQYWLRLWKMCGAPCISDDIFAAFRIHQSSKGKLSFKKQFAEQLRVARQFTQNQAWLFLQQLHNKMIIICYSILK